MVEIHNPGNKVDIKDVWVFMSVDDQGRKGICASILPNLGSTPLISGKYSVIESMKTLAQEISRETGMAGRAVPLRPRREASLDMQDELIS
jgi:hypothetical protein